MRELKIEEVEIEGTKFKIQELSADTMFDIGKLDDKALIGKRVLTASLKDPDVSKDPDFLKKLPAKIATQLLLVINKLNGIDTMDFQKVPGVSPRQTSG